MTNVISNRIARLAFLDRHALNRAPSGGNAQSILQQLHFVQLDSINTAARAHDLIMWSRCQTYKPQHLRETVDSQRVAFEAWTHDASILPMDQYPHWQHKFAHDKARLERRWSSDRRGDFLAQTQKIIEQIATHGPVGSGDVGVGEKRGSGGWWDWHPSKTALEYLWRTGQIAVTRRDGFRKLYDLSAHVIPGEFLAHQTEWAETCDWACLTAIKALGFANAKEIADFFELVPVTDARAWVSEGLKSGRLSPVLVQGADRTTTEQVCLTDNIETLQNVTPSTKRARILSPFDPAIRNRKRALELFGFDYRIEVFVPQAKRTYGYYVFPILDGTTFVGRIDMKANRKTSTLEIIGYWPE
ncbi:MAG: winged helix-turn-helix domain-containing protein, partial [Planktomarina sp.]